MHRSRFVVFLDVGDTLVDGRAELDHGLQVLAALGLAVSRETIRLAYISAWNQLAPDGAHPQASASQAAYREFQKTVYELTAQECGLDQEDDVEKAALDCLNFTFDDPNVLPPFPDAQPVLSRLARDYRLFAVSNWPWELPEFLVNCGLRRYFEGVTASAQVGYRKPHPQIFQTALAMADVEPERVVMVGDSYESDVLGAQGVGISAALVNRWGVPEGARCPVIESLKELPGLLDSLFRRLDNV